MNFKQIAALFMALTLCVMLVACGGEPPVSSTAGTSAEATSGNQETTATTSTTPVETTTETTTETTAETTTATVDPKEPVTGETDHQSVSVGDYVTLVYNEMTCTVETKVEQGLGSKQNVTLTVKMKSAFNFDGFSVGDALANEKVQVASEETTYTLTASEKTTVYVNTSMTIVYHANGGTVVENKDSDIYTDSYSLVFYHNPNTLPENYYFTRDGYLLTGYNTKADGTGETVYLGNKIDAKTASRLDLYCVWEKETDASSFAFSNGRITGYNGTDKTVVIPEKINGVAVKTIASGAFVNAPMTRLVIGPSVSRVEGGAFQNCSALKTLVLFDASFSSGGITEDCFTDWTSLKQLRVNATHTTSNDWTRYGSVKLDRLMWASDAKKIVIVGGSGSYYGYNGSIMDAMLSGEYEIINFGENANITATLYFDIAEEFMKDGDILLWSPEPGTYTLGGGFGIGNRFWAFRQSDYGFLNYIDDISWYPGLIDAFAAFCGELNGKPFVGNDSKPVSTDLYGDNATDNKTKGQTYDYSFFYSVGFDMPDLIDRIQNKGAEVLFTFAAMQDYGMKSIDNEEMESYIDKIKASGVTMISDYHDCIYDDDMFFDSAWHMTYEGAKVRTERVAKDILAYLSK